MDNQVEKIRELLLKNKKPSYQTTNRREVRVRCPYCGDSKKDRNHAHLYIEMNPPFKFYCQKCSTGGVLNNQTLRDLNVFNNDASVAIIEANKTIKRTEGVQKISVKKYTPKMTTVESPQTINCINYVSSRYNMQFTNEYLVNKFKAITNSRQFFEDNKIMIPVDQYRRPLYDFDNSIGFLSSDNSHIIFRDITGRQPKRYYNMALFQDDEKSITNKLYNIKSSVDILSDEINLIITEGVFDIIGVYEHFYKDKVAEKNNYIFSAAAGKGYGAVISNYIRMGFLNLNVSIYSDSDVDINFYKDLKSSLFYLKNTSITIFYNTMEKDFGVPRDNISLRKAIV
jgi:hypothetical protein